MLFFRFFQEKCPKSEKMLFFHDISDFDSNHSMFGSEHTFSAHIIILFCMHILLNKMVDKENWKLI